MFVTYLYVSNMVQAKSQLFSHEVQEIAEMFKALSHPARVEILRFLSRQENCFCGNITEEIPLGRTTINQHLSELKRVGLIQGSVSGSKVNYCLSEKGLAKLRKASDGFLSKVLETRIQCDINIKE